MKYARYRSTGAFDEDALTRMIAAGRGCPGARAAHRLALASTELGGGARVHAGLVATALDLPPGTFCLECTASDRAATEAAGALGTGLVLAAGGPWAAAVLLDAPLPMQSAVAAYPPADAPDYVEMAYLDLVTEAARGMRADLLALNPPAARLAPRAAAALGFPRAFTAPEGAGAAGPLLALFDALEQAAPGQRVLLVSYGAGAAADALLVTKEGS